MERDLFISHASADFDSAKLLADALEQRGLTCWIAPRDITVGEDYAESIIKGIRSCRSLITVLSAKSQASRNVIREVERAHALDLTLLTVRLENIEPSGSLEYFLASRQFIDAFNFRRSRAGQIASEIHEAIGPDSRTTLTGNDQPNKPAASSGSEAAPRNVTSPVWDLVHGRATLLAALALAVIAIGAAAIAAARPSDDDAQPPTSSTIEAESSEVDDATTSTSDPTPTTDQSVAPTTEALSADTDPAIDATVVIGPAPGRTDGWVAGSGADPLRTRNWRSAGPKTEPAEAWRIDDPIGGHPVVASGVLYAAFADQTIRAIDVNTGGEIWSRETGFGGRTPTVTDEAVFYVDGFDVVATDRTSGTEELLRISPPTGVEVRVSPESPTVVDGFAYIMYSGLDDKTWTGNLVAVDLDSGEIKWTWSAVSERSPLPVMIADGLIATVAGAEIKVLDKDTGQEQWAHTLSGELTPNMALIAEGAVIVRDGRLRALDLTDGSQRWADPDSSLQYASANGLVFTQSLDVHAVNAATGAPVWETGWSPGVLLSDAISVGEDVVYVHGSSTGNIGAFDSDTGDELWVINHAGGLAPGVPIALGEGTLVAVETDRQLVGFR